MGCSYGVSVNGRVRMTGLSIVAALVIGLIELMQVLTPELGLTGGVWGWIQNMDFGILGYVLAGVFVLSWAVSYGIWKFMKVEQRWTSD